MKILRVSVCGLLLSLVNVFSIAVAGGLGCSEAAAVVPALPTAALVNLVVFCGWALVWRHVWARSLISLDTESLGWAYIEALAWGPLLFGLIHYVIQGLWPARTLFLLLWLFQLLLNGFAVSLSVGLIGFGQTRMRFEKNSL